MKKNHTLLLPVHSGTRTPVVILFPFVLHVATQKGQATELDLACNNRTIRQGK